MENMLRKWAVEAKPELERRGYFVQFNEPEFPQQGVSVSLESKDFVGDICHWQPDVFEFGFLSVLTGKDIVLETVNLGNLAALNAYVMELLTTRLPALDPNSSFTVSE